MYIRDITDLKQVQQDLNQVNEELELRVIERTRSLNEYAGRLEASEKLNTDLRTANDHLEVFRIAVINAISAFGADFGGVYYSQRDQMQLAKSMGNTIQPPLIFKPNDNSTIYKFYMHPKVQLFQVNEAPEPLCEFCSYIRSENGNSFLLIPLITKDSLIGILYLVYKTKKTFSGDEEQLANVFVEAIGNTLHRTTVMSQLEQAVSNREQELRVLYEIMAISSENEDLEKILSTSIEKILSLLPFEAGAIHLEENDQMIKKVVFRKSIIVEPEWMDNYFFENKLYEQAIQNKTRYTTINIPEKNVIGLTIPIRNKGFNLGLVTLIGNHFDESDLDHISLITSFADAIGLVVENARQRKRSDELLILEERQRLAHDLHDSVSQSLYGLVISADVGNKLLRLKEYDGLKETLKDIEETALQSLREMRLMLFELRPLFFETVGLAGALEMRLNIVERRSGIDTEMNLCGTEQIPSPLDIEIYGIATEAMNNSLKHSKANLIKIDLEVKSKEVTLKISDDGVGFDMSEQVIGGIGFSSMRERSNRINGQLQIVSKVNQGTRIKLKVPLISKELAELK
jgi:nitrate/nitrite-specific signal transduction histidine kinase